MNTKYYSVYYKGFKIQQEDRGWTIINCPDWSNGPIIAGPHSTPNICKNVIDRIIRNSGS